MGRKADRLEEELAIVEEELIAEKRARRELEAELQAVRDGFSGARPSQALARRAAQPEDDHDEHGGELVAVSPEVEDAENALAELRNPTPSPGSRMGPRVPETYSQIVDANKREREFLNEAQRTSNQLVSRIAGALGVTKWDNDGSQLLERINRFVTLKYWLERRAKLAEKQPDNPALTVRASELRLILGMLVADEPDVASLLQEKTPTISAEAVETLLSGVASDVRKITKADLVTLRDALAAYALEKGLSDLHPWLAEAVKSDVGTREFLLLLNHILLPTLVRLRGPAR